MAVKKIVLAFEGSEDSKKALDWTMEFVGQSAMELHIVTVQEASGVVALEADYQVIDMDKIRGEWLKQLNEMSKTLCDGRSCTIRNRVLEGDAAEELIRYAKEVQADILICGSRGLGNFASLLLGSVAHKLVTYAPCPVMVIK